MKGFFSQMPGLYTRIIMRDSYLESYYLYLREASEILHKRYT